MSIGISIPKWIPPRIEESIVVNDHPRIGHNRIRRDEGTKSRIVVAGVVVHQAGGVGLLGGEGTVGLAVAGRCALGAVGVVRAAGCRGPRAVCGQ